MYFRVMEQFKKLLLHKIGSIDTIGKNNTVLKGEILDAIREHDFSDTQTEAPPIEGLQITSINNKALRVSKIEVGDILFYTPLCHPILILRINKNGTYFTVLSTKDTDSLGEINTMYYENSSYYKPILSCSKQTDLTLYRWMFKPGPAKAQITFWGKNCPQFGVPELVTFNLVEVSSEKQEERVSKAIQAQVKSELNRKRSNYKREIEKLQKAEKEIQDKLNQIKNESV